MSTNLLRALRSIDAQRCLVALVCTFVIGGQAASGGDELSSDGEASNESQYADYIYPGASGDGDLFIDSPDAWDWYRFDVHEDDGFTGCRIQLGSHTDNRAWLAVYDEQFQFLYSDEADYLAEYTTGVGRYYFVVWSTMGAGACSYRLNLYPQPE